MRANSPKICRFVAISVRTAIYPRQYFTVQKYGIVSYYPTIYLIYYNNLPVSTNPLYTAQRDFCPCFSSMKWALF